MFRVGLVAGLQGTPVDLEFKEINPYILV